MVTRLRIWRMGGGRRKRQHGKNKEVNNKINVKFCSVRNAVHEVSRHWEEKFLVKCYGQSNPAATIRVLKFRMRPPHWGKTPWGGSWLAGNSDSPKMAGRTAQLPSLCPKLCWWSATGFGGLCWEMHWVALPGSSVTCWMQHEMSWQVALTFTLASFPTSLAPGHGLSTFCLKANTHQLPRALELCRWRALNSSWLLFSGFQHGILHHIQWDKFQFIFF